MTLATPDRGKGKSAPRAATPSPADARPNDLFHWPTRLVTASVEAAAQAVRGGKFSFLSPGSEEISDDVLGLREALLVRAPGGQSVQLIEK